MNIKSEVKSYIKIMINTKKWPHGMQLPTEHQLAKTFFCSRLTIRNAYQSLVENGYLKVKKGVGYFVDKRFLSIVEANTGKKTVYFEPKEATISDVDLKMFDKIKTKSYSVTDKHRVYVKSYYDSKNKEPHQIIKAFVKPTLFKKLNKKDLENSIAYAYLENDIKLERRKRMIISRKLTEEEKKEFKIKSNKEYIVSYNVLIGIDKKPIEFSIIFNEIGYVEIYSDEILV